MSTQSWTGHCVKTEIRRHIREELAQFELGDEEPDSGFLGCSYSFGLWLVLSVVFGLGLFLALGDIGHALVMGMFCAGLVSLIFLSLLGHPETQWIAMEVVWAVRQRLLWLIGEASTVKDPGWVKQTARIPVTITLDESASEPKLSWTFGRDAAEMLSQERTPHHPLGPDAAKNHKDAPDNVQVALLESTGLSFNLTRPPDDEGSVHLTLGAGMERLAFAFDAKRLGITEDARQALPKLAQDAVTLPEAEQGSLLAAFERVGDALGSPVPAVVRVREQVQGG